MRNFIIIISLLAFTNTSFAQNYKLPAWFESLPVSLHGEIYSVGVSDPRSDDMDFALEVAIQRALCFAVLKHETTIHFVADHFETRSEEYRWYILKEKIQEMSRFNASAFIDENSYEVVATEKNENNELFVLLMYKPNKMLKKNYYVKGEYFRQDFEMSNTRSLETIRSLKIETEWQRDKKDTLRTKFLMTNLNGSITSDIFYDTLELKPPGYFYRYFNTCTGSFNLTDFNYGTPLGKGVWVAFQESFIQSCIRISRNYSSKMGTVNDDFDVNRNDEITETTRQRLYRTSCINTLYFCIHRVCVNENHLYPLVSMNDKRSVYKKPPEINTETQNKDDSPKKRFQWFKNIFRKNKKAK